MMHKNRSMQGKQTGKGHPFGSVGMTAVAGWETNAEKSRRAKRTRGETIEVKKYVGVKRVCLRLDERLRRLDLSRFPCSL